MGLFVFWRKNKGFRASGRKQKYPFGAKYLTMGLRPMGPWPIRFLMA
jgi:hypothetical protein